MTIDDDRIKILAYEGIGPISKAIRMRTRSPVSHIAVQLPDASVIEAWGTGWMNGKVRHVDDFRDQHRKRTKVTFYTFDYTGFNEDLAIEFLRDQVGKKYDYFSVLAFMTPHRAPENDKWFCSELSEATTAVGGRELLRGSPSMHAPRDTIMSLELEEEGVLWV